MTPAPVDRHRAKSNPWGLTAYQCMTLRLYCKHGCTKRVAQHEDIKERNVENHVHLARQRMGLLGNDVRLYLLFDRWTKTATKKEEAK